MFFGDEIEKFTKRFETLERMLVVLTEKVLDNHLATMKGINAVMKTFVSQSDAYQQSVKMFDVCARAFQQVREACECLREDLSEASGTLVEHTYMSND